MTPAQLKIRKVRMIDIAKDKGAESGPESDPSKFHSFKANRGPLSPGWHLESDPIMCCYKIATIKFDIPLMSSRAESTIEKVRFIFNTRMTHTISYLATIRFTARIRSSNCCSNG